MEEIELELSDKADFRLLQEKYKNRSYTTTLKLNKGIVEAARKKYPGSLSEMVNDFLIQITVPPTPQEDEYQRIKERIEQKKKELADEERLAKQYEDDIKIKAHIERLLRIEQKYPGKALMDYLALSVQNGSGLSRITIKPELLAQWWGIKFDRIKLNEEYGSMQNMYDSIMAEGHSYEELADEYSIKWVVRKCREGNRILSALREELGLDDE